MPHVIGLVLIGAGVWAGYKALSQAVARAVRELAREDEEMRHRQQRTAQPIEKNLGTLVFDPESGVYKPHKAEGV